MKHIVITGASGLVATELTLKLLEETDAKLYLLSTHPENVKNRYPGFDGRFNAFDFESFSAFARKKQVWFDICIHAAFARSKSGKEIVSSLSFQQDLLYLFKEIGLGCFVNISSQSVYGTTAPLWTEDSQLDPDYLYAMGKYSSEIITKLMLSDSDIEFTNIRLCSVCENARFVRVFVQNAIEGKTICVTAPDQHCSFIDVRDVASGLLRLIERDDDMKLLPVYNLGANYVNSISDVAKRVKVIGESKYGIREVTIAEETSDNHARVGMDASVFMNAFNWTPLYDIDDMIVSIYELILHPFDGGVLNHL